MTAHSSVGDVLDRVDALIASRSILTHPFYVAWERGELTRDQLATYATLYYPHVRAFPSHLEATLTDTTDPLTHAELTRNLTDERSVPKPHHELWLDFAEALDLDRGEVAARAPSSATTAIIETFNRLAHAGVSTGLAALYAYESQQPEVSQRKIDGLKRFYGIDDDHALGYFSVHATTDILHRAGERDALGRCLADGVAPSVVLDATNDTLDAYWGLLDGVCAAADLPVTTGS